VEWMKPVDLSPRTTPNGKFRTVITARSYHLQCQCVHPSAAIRTAAPEPGSARSTRPAVDFDDGTAREPSSPRGDHAETRVLGGMTATRPQPSHRQAGGHDAGLPANLDRRLSAPSAALNAREVASRNLMLGDYALREAFLRAKVPAGTGMSSS